MSHSHSVLSRITRSWFPWSVAAVVLLAACDKNDIVKPQTPATPAPTQTFTAESFSTQGLSITEGQDYKVLKKPQLVSGKQVAEFFWYGCPHCNQIEPAVQAWKKTLPKDVTLQRYHVDFDERTHTHQRLFVTAQHLGLSEQLDGKIFNAIHNAGRGINADETANAFIAEQGVDMAAWNKAYRGFEVNANIVRTNELAKAYELEGVPAFIVNGKYLVGGDTAHTLRVINKLLEQK